MVYPIIKITLGPLIRLIFIKKVTGLNNIPSKGAFILAINHESYIDPMTLGPIIVSRINRKVHFPAKKWGNWLIDYLTLKWLGCVHVNGSTKKLVKLLEKGEVVAMFPEGERSWDGKLQKAHTGVAYLALKTGVPVIPVGMMGGFELWPRTQKWPKLRKRVIMKVGKPIYLKSKKITKKVLNQATTKIMRQIGKLVREKYPT